jgi:hypothetical protein
MKIDWTGLKLNTEFIEIGKAFMVHMLEKYSPSTAGQGIEESPDSATTFI